MTNAGLGNPCSTQIEAYNLGGDTETKDMKKFFEWGYNTFLEEEKPKRLKLLKKRIMDILKLAMLMWVAERYLLIL